MRTKTARDVRTLLDRVQHDLHSFGRTKAKDGVRPKAIHSVTGKPCHPNNKMAEAFMSLEGNLIWHNRMQGFPANVRYNAEIELGKAMGYSPTLYSNPKYMGALAVTILDHEKDLRKVLRVITKAIKNVEKQAKVSA